MTFWCDMAAPVYDRAEEYRPQTRDEMRVAAVELAARGLLPRDIAQALDLAEGAVLTLLEGGHA